MISRPNDQGGYKQTPEIVNAPETGHCQQAASDDVTSASERLRRKQSTAFIVDMKKDGERDGGRDGGRNGWRNGGKNGVKKGGKDGGKDGWKDGGKEDEKVEALSSSLPSFQINDHLCSFLPRARKMSMIKRETILKMKFVNGKEGAEEDRDDEVSEHGTYVVENDIEEDVDEHKEEGGDDGDDDGGKRNDKDATKDGLKVENDLEKSCESFYETASINCDSLESSFHEHILLDPPEESIPGGKDQQQGEVDSGIKTTEKRRNEKSKSGNRLMRQRTFKLSANDDITQTDNDNNDKNNNDKMTFNQGTFVRNKKKEHLETGEIFKNGEKNEEADEFYTDRTDGIKSQETSFLYKETPWQIDTFEGSETNRSLDTEVLLMETPKMIKKVEKKERKEALEAEKKEAETNSNKSQRINLQFDNEASTRQLDEVALNASPISTGRSLKTEVLLKPTEEIKDQLRSLPRVVISKKPLKTLSLEERPIKLHGGDVLKCKNLSSIFNSPELIEDEAPFSNSAAKGIRSNAEKSVSSTSGLSVISDSRSHLEVRKIIEDLDRRINSNKSKNGMKDVSKELDSVRLSPISSPPSSPSSHFHSLASGADSSRSKNTGVSLGQEIVKVSRFNLRRGNSFVPPCKRAMEAQLSNDFDVEFFGKASRSAKPSFARSKMSASSAGLLLSRTHSSASSTSLISDLSVRGSSFRTHLPKTKLKQREGNTPNNICRGEVSNMSAILKISADIQLLSENILDLVKGRGKVRASEEDAEVLKELRQSLEESKVKLSDLFNTMNSNAKTKKF